jgi:hypothetical protein
MTPFVSRAGIQRLDDGRRELAATVGTDRLWFRVPPEWPLTLRGEPFAIAALPLAMALGVPLELDRDLPVSPTLLAGMEVLQRIYRLWGPKFHRPFTEVPVRATADPDGAPRAPTMSFFSGGVDGLYTLLHAPQPVTQAVVMRGIDLQLDNPLWNEVVERNRTWLASRGVPLVAIESNIRFVGHRAGVRWPMYFGAALAATGHALGAGTLLIAAGHTWRELWADGSHPFSDPLWSSEATRVVHHGRGLKRWQKLAAVIDEPGVPDLLRVCWQDEDYNCGRCEKCLRTMVLLRLLGRSSPAFPPLDLELVARATPSDRSEACFVEEALVLANARGDREVARALDISLRRWYVRRLAGAAKRLIRRRD